MEEKKESKFKNILILVFIIIVLIMILYEKTPVSTNVSEDTNQIITNTTEEKYKQDTNLTVFKDDKYGLRFYYDKDMTNVAVNPAIKLSLTKDSYLFNYATYSNPNVTDMNEVIANYVHTLTTQGNTVIDRQVVTISNISPIEATKIVLQNEAGYSIVYNLFKDNTLITFQIFSEIRDYDGFDIILESIIVE